MHPTIDEQLDGARRLLDRVMADDGLSAASQESIVNVQRLLKQIDRSWSALLPFLADDNRTMSELLTHAAPLAPPDLAAELADLSPSDTAAGDSAARDSALDVTTASARNAELRGMLALLIAALPPGPSGDTVRIEIGDYLRHRTDVDPS